MFIRPPSWDRHTASYSKFRLVFANNPNYTEHWLGSETRGWLTLNARKVSDYSSSISRR
jgi:hypothetical protein